jgi:hypothetical protein
VGQVIRTSCLECGEQFEMSRGGGFTFHQLGCDRCGRTTAVSLAALGDLHLRYLAGLPTPFAVSASDTVSETAKAEPISEEEYQREVEKIAGKCSCGGEFTFAAPPRCPRCRSTRLAKGTIVICYD